MKSLLLLIVSLLLVSLGVSAISYPCSVANCQYCSFPGFCGLCSNNYILQINSTTSVPSCVAVSCVVANCQTCYQNNTCSICASGYYVTANGTCGSGTQYTCPTGCISCLSSTSTTCQLCAYGYNLQNGACFPNNGLAVTNCQAYFSGYACQLCQPNYMLNIAYQCVAVPTFNCTVANCASCSAASTCSACLPAYQVNLGNCVAQQCSITNCL